MDKRTERLIYAMNKSGMKAIDLAIKSGVSRGTIHHYINGDYIPKYDRAVLLADALGVSPDWLMGDDVPMIVDSNNMLFSISKQLIKARENKGLTVEQLAKLLNIPATRLLDMESGKDRDIDVELMYKTCQILNLPYSTFLSNMKPIHTIGTNLKLLRQVNQVTTKDLAEAFQMNEITLKEMEDEIIKPTFSVVQKYCDYFNVHVDRLMCTDYTISTKDEKFIIEVRMRHIAKIWNDKVGVSNFTEEEINELMRYANYLVFKRNGNI